MKLNNYDFEIFEKAYLKNNERAFKDSDLDFLASIPGNLKDILFLRAKKKFQYKKVSFTCNIECRVYLAVPQEDISIVPD